MRRALIVLSTEALKRVLNLPESVVVTAVSTDPAAGVVTIGLVNAGWETSELGVPIAFHPQEFVDNNGRTVLECSLPLVFDN